MWQHIQTNTDAQLNTMMDSIYHNLNKKLDVLHKQEQHSNNKTTEEHAFHKRLIN